MDDDGVDLVALDHADIEETGILGVHGGMDETAIAVAMILWRLNQSNLGIGKAGDQIPEPLRIDHIVRVDDADDLGIGGGLRHREPERCGLESLEVLDAEELEARTKFAAARLDRLPKCRIRGVVDDDHAFKIRVVEPRHRIDGAQQHLRRLPVGGNMDRDFWRARSGFGGDNTQQPHGSRPNATVAISLTRESTIGASKPSSGSAIANVITSPCRR